MLEVPGEGPAQLDAADRITDVLLQSTG